MDGACAGATGGAAAAGGRPLRPAPRPGDTDSDQMETVVLGGDGARYDTIKRRPASVASELGEAEAQVGAAEREAARLAVAAKRWTDEEKRNWVRPKGSGVTVERRNLSLRCACTM